MPIGFPQSAVLQTADCSHPLGAADSPAGAVNFQPPGQRVFPSSFNQPATNGQPLLETPAVPEAVAIVVQVVQELGPRLGRGWRWIGRSGALKVLDELGSSHL